MNLFFNSMLNMLYIPLKRFDLTHYNRFNLNYSSFRNIAGLRNV